MMKKRDLVFPRILNQTNECRIDSTFDLFSILIKCESFSEWTTEIFHRNHRDYKYNDDDCQSVARSKIWKYFYILPSISLRHGHRNFSSKNTVIAILIIRASRLSPTFVCWRRSSHHYAQCRTARGLLRSAYVKAHRIASHHRYFRVLGNAIRFFAVGVRSSIARGWAPRGWSCVVAQHR